MPERGEAFIAKARGLLDKNGVGAGEVRWALFHLNRAQLEERLGHWDAADEAYLAALRVYEAADALPGDQAQCRTGHARMLLRRGAVAEARAIFEEALAVEEREFGATHPGLVDALVGLAEALERSGDHAAAVATAWRGVDGLAGHTIEPLALADAESVAAAVFFDDPALMREAEVLMNDAAELAATRPRVWPWVNERLSAWPRGAVRDGW